MKNSALKLLAQKAKKRLSSAGQNLNQDTGEKTAYLSSASYAIVASKQMMEEDPLFENVKRIVETGDCYNPLSRLTNKAEFNKLDSDQKERYILDVAKRYNNIREFISRDM